eukprot:jgi/Pico_ML_1/56074/g1668.t2
MVVDDQFSITRVSFGTIGLVTGVGLLVYGFGAYFDLLPGGSLSALMLIYGFPATIVGFALKYAELKPVPCKTTTQATQLRETKATDIQKQWMDRLPKFQSFFGPGIVAKMNPVPGGMDVALITDGSGLGKDGKDQGCSLQQVWHAGDPRLARNLTVFRQSR